MKRIIITGANGYIGTKLLSKLYLNNKILAISKNSNLLLDKNITYCNPKSADLEQMIINFNPNIVISTTCCYETDPQFIDKTIDANYVFPVEILRIVGHIKNSKKIRFISLGSSLPPDLNLYSLTKRQFSEIGNFFCDQNKIEFCNILLESFYGEDEPENRFIKRCIILLKNNESLKLTEGLQQRDYIYVKDVIDAIYYIALTDKKIPRNIPLGSGISPSIREIINYLKIETHSKSTLLFGSVPSRKNEPSTWANLSILRSLGYTKEFMNWKEGMKLMIGDKK